MAEKIKRSELPNYLDWLRRLIRTEETHYTNRKRNDNLIDNKKDNKGGGIK